MTREGPSPASRCATPLASHARTFACACASRACPLSNAAAIGASCGKGGSGSSTVPELELAYANDDLVLATGAPLAPNQPHRVALAADAKNPGTFTGAFTFVAPSTGDWRANVSTRAAWIDIAPKGGAPLTSKACSHANPPGFLKGPLYALTAGQTYEIRFTKAPAAELDVLLQPFAN